MANKGGRLEGKVAVITGAARGIGAGCARRFAEEGAKVLIADILEDLGEGVAKEITEAGGTASFLRTDVTQAPDVAAMVEAAVEHYGRLDILWNNAGGSKMGSDPGETELEKLTAEEWDFTMALNVRSAFLCLKYATPVMRKAGGGVILCTSSGAGVRGAEGLYHYSVGKAALDRLIQSFAQTIGRDNIRLNGIAPGMTRTEAFLRSLPPGVDESVMKIGQPLPRAGTPLDIANAGVFLASDEASFITGVVLPVDGGWLAQAPHGARFVVAMHEAAQRNPEGAKPEPE